MRSPTPTHALLALLVAAAIPLAGCGDDGGTSSPLDEALGFLPQDAGFAFIASTDLDDYEDVRALIERFPIGGRAEDALRESLQEEGLDFERDVEPLLGNEVVIGTGDNASFIDESGDTPFVLAIETQDGDKLRELVERDGRAQGESEGYDLYQGREDDTWVAVKDDVLVLSDDEQTLRDALEQRGGDDRLTEDDVEEAFDELPEDAPIRLYANVGALLEASPDAQAARKVKWVEQLETLGLTADASEDAISVEFALNTDPEGLSDDDLPIASGTEAPQLLERGRDGEQFVVGLRDPAQVVEFAQAAAKVVDPAGYAEYETGKVALGRRLGIDVDEDLVGQIGDVTAAVSLDGTFGVRAELADASAFEDTLARVMERLPELAGATVTRDGQFYEVAAEGETVAVGVADGALVAADTPARAAEVARRALVDAEGQEGAFVAVADVERLVNAVLDQLRSAFGVVGGSVFTGPLGDLTQSLSASTDALTGRLELTLDD
jgi:hypothetical protein